MFLILHDRGVMQVECGYFTPVLDQLRKLSVPALKIVKVESWSGIGGVVVQRSRQAIGNELDHQGRGNKIWVL